MKRFNSLICILERRLKECCFIVTSPGILLQYIFMCLRLVISYTFTAFVLMNGIIPIASALDEPVAIDSRIKHFVFSPNEVFRVVLHYGYQTSIEFSNSEEIQTISIGNNYAWQITPLGKRLFIKPLEDNILTNMTIITSKRTYQFELQSKPYSYALDEELVYVVRFFYPDEGHDSIDDVKQGYFMDRMEEEALPSIKPYNFSYTIEGSKSLAPIRVFDNGINTFFEFEHGIQNIPNIAVQIDNSFTPIESKIVGKYLVANIIAKKFKLFRGKEVAEITKNQSQ